MRGLAQPPLAAGFTLPELLISIGIIGIITALVIVKYSSFDSVTILKSSAYEIALALREAQVKSVSVVRGTAGFDYPYGVQLKVGQSTYQPFLYKGSGSKKPHLTTDTSKSETVGPLLSLNNNITVSQICIYGNEDRCDISELDISYQRPEFKSLFFAIKQGDDEEDAIQSGISQAKITVTPKNSTNTFVVTITQLGQISVAKGP